MRHFLTHAKQESAEVPNSKSQNPSSKFQIPSFKEARSPKCQTPNPAGDQDSDLEFPGFFRTWALELGTWNLKSSAPTFASNLALRTPTLRRHRAVTGNFQARRASQY